MLKNFVFVWISVIVSTLSAVPQVTIEEGTLKGSVRKSLNGRNFNSFTGIPYAEPPVGELRFKRSVPALGWEGVFDATEKHPACPQIDVFMDKHDIRGDEDCLYLNVYTPQLKSNDQALFPVMFYIHGGGWICGEANIYKPDALLNHDIVLVTVNYRLGALGFLSTGDSVVPGNNGLKDQNLALKWVKRNIIYFGGDPDNITIFGQSAGGASVHYHLLSPLSKGLIKRAIIQSGSALSPWALGTKKKSHENVKKLANLLNCTYTSSESLVECLQKVSAYKIIEQDYQFMEWSYHPMIPFRPVIEKESSDAFLTDEPANIIKSNKTANVPIIIGLTTEDGAISTSFIYNRIKLVEDLNSNFDRIAPILLLHNKNIESFQKIRHFYFRNSPINDATKHNLTNMITDAWFQIPIYNTIKLHAQHSKENIYYYLFSYRGAESFTLLFGDIKDEFDYGVCHSDELIYLFNARIKENIIRSPEDLRMGNVLTTLWTNFARTGNPTPSTNEIITAIWKPIETDDYSHFFISDNMKMQRADNLKKLKLWEEIPHDFKLNRVYDEL